MTTTSVTSDTPTVEPIEAPMRIGGESVSGAQRVEIRSPGDTRQRVGSIAIATETDVGAAVRAAFDAFRVWSAIPIGERADALRRASDALVEGEDLRSLVLASENGQTLAEARGGVRGCARTLRYYADMAASFEMVEELPTPNGRVVVGRKPMGVAALIVPWNAPTRLAFLGLAPILLAGNTVVVKPPSEAPLALIDALMAIEPLFPTGTINIVTGPGDAVGRALVSHPLVRKINFTGSTDVGKEILRLSADTVKRVSLELGGNDPAIVLADADIERAVPELVRGAFGLSGQMCYDVKRIYVDREVYDDFVDRFIETTDKLIVGNGLDPRATMGSMISDGQRRRIDGMVDSARQDGAKVTDLGQKLDRDSWEHGYFRLPSVITEVDERSEVVSAEQFGPAIPIMAYSSIEEAVERANSTEYGLAASVWSQDEERAFELAQRIQAGSTFVNIHRLGASGDDMPFGGFKESGLGRSHGVIALEEQFELQTLSSRVPG
jgi:aldehyde dehydrogenase